MYTIVMTGIPFDIISEACERGNKVILVLRNGNGWYEGIVERIYEGDVVRFASRLPGSSVVVTGFLLLSDILDVIY